MLNFKTKIGIGLSCFKSHALRNDKAIELHQFNESDFLILINLNCQHVRLYKHVLMHY